ncbi:hypothetical protein HY622_00305 [Candidatus Uhrbacteria bacterium]|nr:hypothetical protein [Candidatus Uhrbacteria bacterium]
MQDSPEKRAKAVKIIVGICFALILVAYLPLAFGRIKALFHSLGQASATAEERTQQLWGGGVSEKFKAAAQRTQEQWSAFQEFQANQKQSQSDETSPNEIIEFTQEVQRAVADQTASSSATSTQH